MTSANGPRIVLAPDSFKESLSAPQVCRAMQAGLSRALPGATFTAVPMADGGEGTVAAVAAATGGEMVELEVTGPLGDPARTRYGLLDGGRRAVLEMASASGLEILPDGRRDALRASTFGTGELIRDCLGRGVRHLLIGIGGSATNDGGAGMAQALGARLLDADGRELGPGGAELARLARIDTSGLDPRLAELTVDVACDVTNPLCGPTGASAVFGPQKGASAAQVALLDQALSRYADLLARDLGRDVRDVEGAGAAGGLGAGLLAFTRAQLRSGIDLVMEHTRLAEQVAGAALVVTGEGRIDGQTAFGKTPSGVARLAREAGVPVVALAGSLGDGVEQLDDVFDAVLPVVDRVATLPEVLAAAAENVERASFMLGRLVGLKPFD